MSHNENHNEKDKFISLGNIGSVVSLSLLIAVTFALVRFHFYYQILLHVPIFQLIDASKLVLITAGYGIKWLFYLGTISLVTFISKEKGFTDFQKFIFTLIILSFGGFYLWLNYHNDPSMRQSYEWPMQFEWWYIIALLLFIGYIIAFMRPYPNGPLFFQKNRLILPLIATVWYALFESWISYKVITNSKHTNNIIVHAKIHALNSLDSLCIIKTNDTIIDAGWTKSYWFYYNRKTHLTRSVKTLDIDYVDFDAQSR